MVCFLFEQFLKKRLQKTELLMMPGKISPMFLSPFITEEVSQLSDIVLKVP